MRPLKVSTGAHRDSAIPAGMVKAGVVGALATATIAVPLATATAGDQPAPASAAIPAPAEVPSAPASSVTIPTVHGSLESRAGADAASRAAERSAPADDADAAQQDEEQQVPSTGIEVEAPEPVAVDESGAEIPQSDSGFIRPVGGPITSGYGYRTHPVLGYRKMHEGVDFGSGCGTPVRASQAGTVTAVEYTSSSGKRVKVDHGNGITTGYYHLQGYATSVGATVKQGEVVGYVGSTGRSTGCHLHFAVMDDSGNYSNPMSILR